LEEDEFQRWKLSHNDYFLFFDKESKGNLGVASVGGITIDLGGHQ